MVQHTKVVDSTIDSPLKVYNLQKQSAHEWNNRFRTAIQLHTEEGLERYHTLLPSDRT